MDSSGDAGSMAAAGGAMLFAFVFAFLVYAYFAYTLMVIAQKTGKENGWMAWIPIANIWLMVQIAEKEWWWFLLFFVPFVNWIAMIMVWMAIAEKRGKPSWWGILLLVPIVNIIVPGYLAFTE